MIEMTAIHKSFERSGAPPLGVLGGLDFTVEPGEFVSIMGPSGSGKTTLMNILGLLDRPDTGAYRLAGRATDEMDGAALARTRNETLGFVFQQFHLLPKTTAVENVELPLIYSRTRQPRRKAVDALCRVGLEDRLGHYPDQLSGGQQQRVAIARALVNSPSVILADEPTGNLDSESSREVLELFEKLHADGATLLMITHDPDVAHRAGRSVRLDAGRLAPMAGAPSQKRRSRR